MNKKLVILSFISIFALTLLLPAASARVQPQPSAVGAGAFVMEHEDGIHRHFFAFSVKDPTDPKGTFHLVCLHNNELCMIIQSEEILTFSVAKISGDLRAIFMGTARVKMQGEDWTDGWMFTVTVFDVSKKGKGNDIFILDLTNSEVHHMEGTLTAGNIVINK